MSQRRQRWTHGGGIAGSAGSGSRLGSAARLACAGALLLLLAPALVRAEGGAAGVAAPSGAEAVQAGQKRSPQQAPGGAARLRASHRVDVIAPGERVDSILDRFRVAPASQPAPPERPLLRPPESLRGGAERPPDRGASRPAPGADRPGQPGDRGAPPGGEGSGGQPPGVPGRGPTGPPAGPPAGPAIDRPHR
jgi:hypothetical protein